MLLSNSREYIRTPGRQIPTEIWQQSFFWHISTVSSIDSSQWQTWSIWRVLTLGEVFWLHIHWRNLAFQGRWVIRCLLVLQLLCSAPIMNTLRRIQASLSGLNITLIYARLNILVCKTSCELHLPYQYRVCSCWRTLYCIVWHHRCPLFQALIIFSG